MADYSIQSGGRSGHLLGTPDLNGVDCTIGGALLRRALEDPDNVEGVQGIVALPAGHRLNALLHRRLSPTTGVIAASGPYVLEDQMTLDIDIDGEEAGTVTFLEEDFVDIAAATAAEVVAAILAAELVGVAARTVRDVFVVHSGDEATQSIQITGGTAAAALGLDTDPHAPFTSGHDSDFDFTVLSTALDDDLMGCIVFDPGFAANDPTPALAAWAAVLSA